MFAPEMRRTRSGGGRSSCFNEAGACLPRKRPDGADSAQQGPASMRPGHVCPGNAASLFASAGPPEASMRPGHVCPGNTPTCARSSVTGRRFNEAGACLPRKEDNVEPFPGKGALQ